MEVILWNCWFLVHWTISSSSHGIQHQKLEASCHCIKRSGYLYVFMWWLLPESPRWLTQKRRFTEAHAILREIARKNNKPCPDITVLAKFCDLEEARERTGQKYTYLDIINNWHYCKITLISMLAWFTAAIVYYQLTFSVRNLSGDRYVNIVFSGIVDFISLLLVIPGCNILGRRLTYHLFMIIALTGNLTLMGLFLTGKENELDKVVMVMVQLGKAATSGAFYVCGIIGAEIFPTVIRNVGLGASSVACRIGAILGPQMVLLGMYHSTVPYILSSLLCLIALPLIFSLPEMKGQPLEDRI